MNFLRGLLAARSHLAILVGIVAALVTIRLATRVVRLSSPAHYPSAATWARELPLRQPRPLTTTELALASDAWSYFTHNTDPRTGLTSSVAGYPSTTIWDLGSQLLATLAAEDLRLVSPDEATHLLTSALASLAALDLVEGLLPNKAYNTRTLRMVGYDNLPANGGVGWSALDIGRLAVSLTAVEHRHPELASMVRRAVARWDLFALSDGTALVGTTRHADGTLERLQEGRFGYEQYAAKGLLAFGVPVGLALDYSAHAVYAEVEGDTVARDDRVPEAHGGTPAPVLSEPWVLGGLEHGLDALTLPHARAVLAAQQRRFAETGKLTAVSEDHLDRPPFFAYSAVLGGTDRWIAFYSNGRRAPQDLTFSTKAAIGWWALFGGDYPDRLYASAVELIDPGHGLWAGRYDATGAVNRVLSLNTNAVVLEALAYLARGPVLRPVRGSDVAEARR
jgi:hypothetical protein